MRSPSRPRHQSESFRHHSLSRWNHFLDQRGASDAQREELRSYHQKSHREKRVHSGTPCLRSWESHFAQRAIRLIYWEVANARKRKNSLMAGRVKTGRRRGLPNIGWEPSLRSHAPIHQFMALAPIGNCLPQPVLPHPSCTSGWARYGEGTQQMGAVVCKPDVEWPKVVADNRVCALPGRDQPTASSQTHSGILWATRGAVHSAGDAFWSESPLSLMFQLLSLHACCGQLSKTGQKRPAQTHPQEVWSSALWRCRRRWMI